MSARGLVAGLSGYLLQSVNVFCFLYIHFHIEGFPKPYSIALCESSLKKPSLPIPSLLQCLSRYAIVRIYANLSDQTPRQAELETWVKALDAYDAQDFPTALSHFESIADSSKVLFNIGLIHATLANHRMAVAFYEQAHLLDQYLAVSFFQ